MTARIEKIGLHYKGGTVLYIDMNTQQLEEVVRDNEAHIQYADFEIADELFKREVVGKIDLRIWPPVPKKPGDKAKEPAKDPRRVVLEEVPDMPSEEVPF
jgi:hypothetical protein